MRARHELSQRYKRLVPRVAPKSAPMTLIAMQYCLEAGTEPLARMDQTGSAIEVLSESVMRIVRSALRLGLTTTG